MTDLTEFNWQESIFPNDIEALNKLMETYICRNMLIAEIGTWKGCSASIMARRLQKVGGQLFVIDHWKGSNGFQKEASNRDVYSIFKSNMVAENLWDIVHPLVMDSKTASKIFRDDILDFVYIDGDHSYEAVKLDISSWLPKLKVNGVMVGHDYYEPDHPRRQGHPGVTQAVKELFSDDYSVMDDSCIWYHIKK